MKTKDAGYIIIIFINQLQEEVQQPDETRMLHVDGRDAKTVLRILLAAMFDEGGPMFEE